MDGWMDGWMWALTKRSDIPPVMGLFSVIELPSMKLTFSPLKMDGWNTIVSFWDGLFSRVMLVSGRVCWSILQFLSEYMVFRSLLRQSGLDTLSGTNPVMSFASQRQAFNNYPSSWHLCVYESSDISVQTLHYTHVLASSFSWFQEFLSGR